MLVVGELINSTRKKIAAAIEAEDVAAIQDIARNQAEAGADYIDVNAGAFGDKEPAYLDWLVKVVQEAVDVPCCIDSPSPKAIEVGLAAHEGPALINSISLEGTRFDDLLPLVAGTENRIVGLCMSDEGMPHGIDDRGELAARLIARLVEGGVKLDHIYIDALVHPLSTDHGSTMRFLRAIDRIMRDHEGVHTICGISNVGFGLPKRKVLNQTFAVMAIAHGLDAAIVNPLDARLMQGMLVAETLAGRDEYCGSYLEAFRAEKLEA